MHSTSMILVCIRGEHKIKLTVRGTGINDILYPYALVYKTLICNLS